MAQGKLNTSDEGRIKANEKQARIDAQEARNAFETFMRTRGGQIWVTNYARGCFVMEMTFTGNSQTFFNEGQRHGANGILKEVAEVNPDAFATIMKELMI